MVSESTRTVPERPSIRSFLSPAAECESSRRRSHTDSLGVQPSQRSASLLTATSSETEMYAATEHSITTGPASNSLTTERSGHESANSAAATGTGSTVSSVATIERAGHRSPANAPDAHYPEDQQTRRGSPALPKFTPPIFLGNQSSHAGFSSIIFWFKDTKNVILYIFLSIEPFLCNSLMIDNFLRGKGSAFARSPV